MEAKRKLRGKWLLALGVVMMAAALCMLRAQPSVLQYCVVAPQEAAPAPQKEAQAEAGTETQPQTEPEQSALATLVAAWDARAEEELGEVLESASIAARDYGFAFSGEGGSATATLTAVGEDWFGVYPRYLVAGRLPTADELQTGARVIALDEPLAFKLFPTVDPVGRSLEIGAKRYRVVGVTRYARGVGQYEQYQAYIPIAAAAKDGLQMEIVELCARPLPRSGASRAFEAAGRTWRAGGTFIDTDKEAMRAGMIARVLAVVLGLYGVLYLLRRLNRRAAAFGANARARLKTEYLRDMLPSLLPRAGVLAVGYALIVAAAFGVLALAVEPMYVFTEWIPDVLVELSSITDRFWQLTSAAASPVFIRTEEYAEIRFWAGVLRWGAVSALVGCAVMAFSARGGKKRGAAIDAPAAAAKGGKKAE